jgi:hypothetical protein
MSPKCFSNACQLHPLHVEEANAGGGHEHVVVEEAANLGVKNE